MEKKILLEENKIYKASELAQWFETSSKTFSNTREQRLKVLSIYCDWEEIGRGKYLITKVYTPEYHKEMNKTYLRVAEALPHYLQEVDTCINIGVKINREVFKDREKPYSDRYIATLVGQVMKDEPEKYKFQKAVGFKKGENGSAIFRTLNKEERKIYREVIEEYIKELSQEKEKDMLEAIDKKNRGEISEREFFKMNFNLSSGFSFTELKIRLKDRLDLTDEQYANRLRDFREESQIKDAEPPLQSSNKGTSQKMI